MDDDDPPPRSELERRRQRGDLEHVEEIERAAERERRREQEEHRRQQERAERRRAEALEAEERAAMQVLREDFSDKQLRTIFRHGATASGRGGDKDDLVLRYLSHIRREGEIERLDQRRIARLAGEVHADRERRILDVLRQFDMEDLRVLFRHGAGEIERQEEARSDVEKRVLELVERVRRESGVEHVDRVRLAQLAQRVYFQRRDPIDSTAPAGGVDLPGWALGLGAVVASAGLGGGGESG